jgi:hypothetical protein
MTSKRLVSYLILVLLAVAVGSILYARYSARHAQALVAEDAAKLRWVTTYLAKTASTDAATARSAIIRHNWGTAQDALTRTGDAIGALEQVALKADHDTVEASRQALQSAQTAVGANNEADASKAVDDLIRALGPLVSE